MDTIRIVSPFPPECLSYNFSVTVSLTFNFKTTPPPPPPPPPIYKVMIQLLDTNGKDVITPILGDVSVPNPTTKIDVAVKAEYENITIVATLLKSTNGGTTYDNANSDSSGVFSISNNCPAKPVVRGIPGPGPVGAKATDAPPVLNAGYEIRTSYIPTTEFKYVYGIMERYHDNGDTTFTYVQIEHVEFAHFFNCSRFYQVEVPNPYKPFDNKSVFKVYFLYTTAEGKTVGVSPKSLLIR